MNSTTLRCSRRFWSLTFIALAMPGLRPLAAAELPPAPLPAEAAFENLKANAPVSWLVRLVAYDPENPALRIDDLSSLGAPHEDFTFVADYAELRGCTVTEAVHKVGGVLHPGQDVSGVIFPIAKHTIFPGSVRGMLQVVQQIDMRRAAEPGYRAAPLDVLLTDAERVNLAAVDIKSWAWESYRAHFLGFAKAFATLSPRNASAVRHIGSIGPAWCEPGCSRLLEPLTPADANTMALDLPGGQTFEIKNFGVRVFLIRNQPVCALPGRVLIDFSDPAQQHIPLDLPGAE